VSCTIGQLKIVCRIILRKPTSLLLSKSLPLKTESYERHPRLLQRQGLFFHLKPLSRLIKTNKAVIRLQGILIYRKGTKKSNILLFIYQICFEIFQDITPAIKYLNIVIPAKAGIQVGTGCRIKSGMTELDYLVARLILQGIDDVYYALYEICLIMIVL